MHKDSHLNLFKRDTGNQNYIPELDGLRFIAIISVIFFHANGRMLKFFCLEIPYISDIMKTGFFGVEIFFAISGYILTKQIISTNNFSFRSS